MTCYDYLYEHGDKAIVIHLCFDAYGRLYEIMIREEKEYSDKSGVRLTMDSEIHCDTGSEASFLEECFDLALRYAEKLLREYSFKELVWSDNDV